MRCSLKKGSFFSNMECGESPLYLDRFVRAQHANTGKETVNTQEDRDGLEARRFYEELTRSDTVHPPRPVPDNDIKQTSPGRSKRSLHNTGRSCSSKIYNTGSNKLEKWRLRQQKRKAICASNDLFKFASEGNLCGLEQLLESEDGLVSVDNRDEYNWTPLMSATAAGHIEIVRYFLKMGAPVYSATDNAGNNAWDIAVKFDKKEIMDIFFELRIKKEQTSDTEIIDDEESIKGATEHCDVCSVDFPKDSKASHLNSTVHLLEQFKNNKTGPQYHLAANNVGYRMLKDKGWSEERGLGPDGKGERKPIATVLKRDRTGLGLKTQNRKRVTHFKSYDYEAIKYNVFDKDRRVQKKFTKEDYERKKKRSKGWEMELRSYMNRE